VYCVIKPELRIDWATEQLLISINLVGTLSTLTSKNLYQYILKIVYYGLIFVLYNLYIQINNIQPSFDNSNFKGGKN